MKTKRKVRIDRVIKCYVVLILLVVSCPNIYGMIHSIFSTKKIAVVDFMETENIEPTTTKTTTTQITSDNADVYSEKLKCFIPFKQQLELQLLIYTEAGNQNIEAQYAVAAVVINRVLSEDYPNDISEVIFQKGQFTPAVPTEEGNGYFMMGNEEFSYVDIPEYCKENIREVALTALDGFDPTNGAIYFFNPELITEKEKHLRSGIVDYQKIDDMVFYKDWPRQPNEYCEVCDKCTSDNYDETYDEYESDDYDETYDEYESDDYNETYDEYESDDYDETYDEYESDDYDETYNEYESDDYDETYNEYESDDYDEAQVPPYQSEITFN